MLRMLILGGIVAYVGKKLHDEGTLTQFKDDLTRRLRPGGATRAVDQPPATGTAPARRRTPEPIA
ncbi:hypothetical protein [Sphingobium aquiterrae]|uniref:hypothetical protein n=1 Tax=Sphingobium aquiterrae TaxID=2038656 RepID=UPI00301909CC